MRRWYTRRHGNFKSMAVHGNIRRCHPLTLPPGREVGRPHPIYSWYLRVFAGIERSVMAVFVRTYHTYLRIA